ncbi:MAG: glycosyltransferase family 1 protein [Acidobacteriaceae bacterium]|nr:glycosyltransferase family 1 protein [Acidobacteriaceae bacterium]
MSPPFAPPSAGLPQRKPRLVFFRYQYPPDLPAFLLRHFAEHVNCLREFFDVILIDRDCDYAWVCDEYQPDLALFESGSNISTSRRLHIWNTNRNRQVAKAGLFNADAWAETRAGTLSEMEHWGVETFFAISTTALEHAPELAGSLYIWPNFIDGGIYRDYGAPKLIPILLTGSTGPQYPWRHRIFALASQHYPTLSCPHPGYLKDPAEAQLLAGERYARAINGSFFAPACGTVAREVVRKHFEIPGAKSCLIAERSLGLEAAGFRDMQNCVFAHENDLLDKLAYLFRHPEKLHAITEAGYCLVHERHTMRSRSQILDWLYLRSGLEAAQIIVQDDPFAPLRVVNSQRKGTALPCANGLHLQLLAAGDERLRRGQFTEAERLYRECLMYMRRLPEAHLRLTLFYLLAGDAQRAEKWILEPITYTLAQYRAFSPEPVEWAWFLITLVCRGALRRAVRRSREFGWLIHPELERARILIRLLAGEENVGSPETAGEQRRSQPSIHTVPFKTTGEWTNAVCAMLRACGRERQAALAEHRLPYLLERAALGNAVTENRSSANALRYFRRRHWGTKVISRLRVLRSSLKRNLRPSAMLSNSASSPTAEPNPVARNS